MFTFQELMGTSSQDKRTDNYISLDLSGTDCNIWACASMHMLEVIVASSGRFAPLRSTRATVAAMMYGTMWTPPVYYQLRGLQRRILPQGARYETMQG